MDGRHPQMNQRKNLCVLAAEVTGGPNLDVELGGLEAKHAIDRCMRRTDLAIEAHQGTTLVREASRISAGFERCDSAVFAACEMLERIQGLPPLRGKRLSVRIGLHYGAVENIGAPLPAIRPTGDGPAVAQRLMRASHSGEALASNTTIMLLSAATRHFARPLATPRADLASLDEAIHSIARQPETVVSLPPATRLVQRLRIRHQDNLLFVDEQRPVLLLGRELGNDVVIMDPRASRQHARIERRKEGFVLIDHSSNGSYVMEDGTSEHCLKNREILLVGPGRVGCGFSTSHVERDLVFFDIV